MTHESRLDLELRRLLTERPVAALGTLDEHGAPFVSMVPFAVEPASGCLVLHGSAAEQPLRAAYLGRHPQAELMTQLPDFAFVRLQPCAVRHVAGFGAARSVDPEVLVRLLSTDT
jgi:heme iron utilization protein